MKQRQPKTLSGIESKKLLEQLGTSTGTPGAKRKAIRNKLIGLLMLEAGLRVGELVQLKITDLVFAGMPVTSLILSKSITKGGHERTVPLSTTIQKAIEEIFIKCWNHLDPLHIRWAFPSTNRYRHITARQVEYIVEHAGISAFGKSIHPHILRHTFASNLMRITNIRVVQQLLGHKSIQTTQIYTHPNQDDLTNAINGIGNAETQTKIQTLENAENNLANSQR